MLFLTFEFYVAQYSNITFQIKNNVTNINIAVTIKVPIIHGFSASALLCFKED